MKSHWVKAISTEGSVRGVVLNATDMVQELARIHQLEGQGAQALGDAAMAALLLASYCKSGERVNLNIQGSKRVKQGIVDAHPDGSVRGYIVERSEPVVEEPAILEVGDGLTLEIKAADTGPWGTGVLAVLRTKVGNQQPYIGTVPLVTGHLAKDYTFYWAQSEQVPTACGLNVELGADGKVVSAGAFLIQTMPGATSAEVDLIEKRVKEIDSFKGHLAPDFSPKELLAELFQDSAFMILEEKDLRVECQCSIERVERALLLIGANELTQMMTDPGQAEVKCDFCATQYVVNRERLGELAAMVTVR